MQRAHKAVSELYRAFGASRAGARLRFARRRLLSALRTLPQKGQNRLKKAFLAVGIRIEKGFSVPDQPAPLVKTSTFHQLTVAVVRIDGALVADAQLEALRGECLDLLAQGNRKLVLDLSAVWLINSAGRQSLLGAQALYRQQGGLVVLCGLSKPGISPYVVATLAEAFDLATSLPEAFALCGLPEPLFAHH